MSPLLAFFASTQPTSAACFTNFLGLIPWYKYLPLNPYPDCSLNLDLINNAHWTELWLVAIALLDDILRVAGFLAISFVIWGGIKLITSQGNPQGVNNARDTIRDALIGVVIAFVATDAINYIGTQLGASAVSASGLPTITSTNPFTTILNIVLGVVGGIALLMVAVGGFKYVVSRGEPQQTASAKNTILYALIGLAVVIMAFSIINFVIYKLGS